MIVIVISGNDCGAMARIMSEISCHKQLVFRNLLMAALRSGKCSGLLGGPPRPGGCLPLRPAARRRNLAVRLALRLATEFKHTQTHVLYSVGSVTYYLTSRPDIVLTCVASFHLTLKWFIKVNVVCCCVLMKSKIH